MGIEKTVPLSLTPLRLIQVIKKIAVMAITTRYSNVSGNAEVLWKAAVGKGYSSVSIQGDYLYTMGNDDGKDTVYCLDFETGAVVWTYSYSQRQGQYPGLPPICTHRPDGSAFHPYAGV